MHADEADVEFVSAGEFVFGTDHYGATEPGREFPDDLQPDADLPEVAVAPHRLTQAVQPGTQQRRGLHVGGEHAARAADKGVHPQRLRPGAQCIRPKALQQPRHLRLARAVALLKLWQRLGVRQVQPTLAGQQKLAAHRGHGVHHVYRHTGCRQHLGGHQAGRAAADDGDAERGERRWGGRHDAGQGESKAEL